jgi:hypothetical protein
MASTRIYRTLASNSNSGKLTISCWVKRSSTGEQGICGSWYSGAYHGILYFSSTGTLNFYDYRSSYIFRKYTSAQFNDFGAWYHVVANFDHTLGSPTGKIYVNGVEQTLATDDNYSQGATSSWLTDYTLNIGTYSGSGNYFDGIIADFYFIQGYVYEASTFGETDATTGQWKPIVDPTINYGGTGGNSCHLKFENSSNLDLDSGTNSVSFTTSGNLIQTLDSPSNNFCVLNGSQRSRMNTNNSGDYLTNGNNTFDTSSSNAMKAIVNGTIGVQSGKWYWESKIITNTKMQVGISTGMEQKFPQAYYDETEYTAMTLNLNGTFTGRYTGSASDEFGTGTANTTNDILGFALDMDNKALYVHKNGVYLSNGSAVGVPTSGSSRTGSLVEGLAGSRDDYFPTGEFMFPVVMDISNSGVAKLEFNFGNGYFGTTQVASEQNPDDGVGKFEYDVPANYRAITIKGINA